MNCDNRCKKDGDPRFMNYDCSSCPGRWEPVRLPVLTNVVQADFRQSNSVERDMANAIREAVYSFAGRVSVAQAVGVLEVVKAEVMSEAEAE